MPLNEIPKFFKPETRALIESSLEDAIADHSSMPTSSPPIPREMR
jgi:hypothetical protein